MRTILALLSLALALPASACGALLGIDDTEVRDDVENPVGVAPSVVAVSPSVDLVGVPVEVEISATFDVPMDPASLDGSTFRLTLGAEPVAGTVGYDEGMRRVTFRPAHRLALRAGYAATLTVGVRSSEGVALKAERRWAFTVRSGGWSNDAEIGEPFQGASGNDVRIAMNGNGDALVVALTSSELVARRLAGGVLDPDRQALTRTGLKSLRVALDGEGTGVVLAQRTTGDIAVFWNRPDGAWEDGPVLSAHLGFEYEVAADPVRGFVAAWVDAGGALQASRLDGVEPVTLDAVANLPRVAFAADRSATLVWRAGLAGQYVIRSSRAAPGVAWSAPADVGTDGTLILDLQLAVADGGAAVAVWHGIVGQSTKKVWWRAAEGGVWGDPAAVLAEGGAGDVAMTAGGDAVAVWWAVDGAAYRVMASRRPRGGIWSDPTVVGDAPEQHDKLQFGLQVAMDRHGNALAAWRNFNVPLSIQRRTVAGDAWGPPRQAKGGMPPRLAVDGRGGAMVCWLEFVNDNPSQIRCDTFR